MELLLILIILAFGAVRFIQFGDDDLPSSSECAEPDAESTERGVSVDYSFNPATGLPMLHEGPGGLDIEGNMWGFDDETLPMHRHPADQSLFHGFEEPLGHELEHPMINPATGLLMVLGSTGGLDVGGNPYGSNLDDTLSRGGLFDSDWGSGSHGTDDYHDSLESGSSSLDSFDFGSGSSGTGFDSDW